MAGKKQGFKDILRNCFPVDVDNLLREQEEETNSGETAVSLPDTVSATDRVLEFHSTPAQDTVAPQATVAPEATVSGADAVSSAAPVSAVDTVAVAATVSPAATV